MDYLYTHVIVCLFMQQSPIELERVGLGFAREIEQAIYYNSFDVGTRRADFIVEQDVLVEIKALVNLEYVHLAQTKNYLTAYNLPIGLLINFGSTSLQFKKVFNSNKSYNKSDQI